MVSPRLLIIVVSAAVLLLVPHARIPSAGFARENNGGAEAGADRVREGTRLEGVIGHFEVTGDRAIFFERESGRRFRALENLALERVIRAVDERPGQANWQVTGMVTEFRGVNFVLLTQVVSQAEESGR